jgi:GMP synthase-like glutamine amidotransferase
VLELPPHAEILASSSTVPHEIFLIHHRFLGVQGHPEVDREGLREGFMPLHRALFDAERWQIVEQESRQPVERDAVIALGRRLLSNGYL